MRGPVDEALYQLEKELSEHLGSWLAASRVADKIDELIVARLLQPAIDLQRKK